ncbi:MAG: hypothetical protein GC156_13140 [Actinomycetales bacterium]|nr:hypothetical protein [Actinomycetales bacterium]
MTRQESADRRRNDRRRYAMSALAITASVGLLTIGLVAGPWSAAADDGTQAPIDEISMTVPGEDPEGAPLTPADPPTEETTSDHTGENPTGENPTGEHGTGEHGTGEHGTGENGTGDTDPGDTDPGDDEVPGYVCDSDPCLVCLATDDAEAPYLPALFERTHIINGEGSIQPTGPAADPLNIVPPVLHKNGKGSFAGLNWNAAGYEVWQGGCGGGEPLPVPDDNGGHQQITVCLATGNPDDPYDAKTLGAQMIINGEGKVKKNSPALDPVDGVFPDEPYGAIIEPFTHPNGKATFAGLNWTPAGEAIQRNGCVYIPPAPPPPPPPAPAPVPEPATVAPEPAVVVEEAPPVPEAVPIVLPATVPAAAPELVAVPTTATPVTQVPAGGGASAPTGGRLAVLAGLVSLLMSILALQRRPEKGC